MPVVNEVVEKSEYPLYVDFVLYIAVCKWLSTAAQTHIDFAFATAGGADKVKDWLNASSKLYDLNDDRENRLIMGQLTPREGDLYRQMRLMNPAPPAPIRTTQSVNTAYIQATGRTT